MRNLDTQSIGRIARVIFEQIVLDSGHLFQPIDGDLDNGIDGYIRLRKKQIIKKVIKHKPVKCVEFVETGNLIGVQIKGVSKIPETGSNSYYVNYANKQKFGVNFGKEESLKKSKIIWENFVGPMLLIFVDNENQICWWADLNNLDSYNDNNYCVSIPKVQIFNSHSFRQINKIGKEHFSVKNLITIDTKNHNFPQITLSDFKNSAKKVYANLSGSGEFYSETINPTLGKIEYSRSGWKHITRLNRRKMRIFNSILLLGISKIICENVTKFTAVKQGITRESERYIKKVDFLTLRANVNFNFRQSAIVQVVLRRVKTFDKIRGENKVPTKVFFHSIYEPYRKE